MPSVVETAIRSTVNKGLGLVADFNRRRMPTGEGHPFLTGIHAPMRDEKTLTDLEVTGSIPAALDGRYLRIGPNPVAPDARGYHWFVGDGMVHAIALKHGRALWYRNRWIRSNEVADALGEAAAPGPRHAFDTVNTNVVSIDGRTFALVEAGSYPVELSDTLDAQRYNPFDDTLKGSFTAHPHRDPVTGEHHAIAYEAGDQEACAPHRALRRRQGAARDADRGRARAVHPRLCGHHPLRDRPRPAGDAVDESGDRRSSLPLPLESVA